MGWVGTTLVLWFSSFDMEACCPVELFMSAARMGTRWRPLCVLLGPGMEQDRTLVHTAGTRDMRQERRLSSRTWRTHAHGGNAHMEEARAGRVWTQRSRPVALLRQVLQRTCMLAMSAFIVVAAMITACLAKPLCRATPAAHPRPVAPLRFSTATLEALACVRVEPSSARGIALCSVHSACSMIEFVR